MLAVIHYCALQLEVELSQQRHEGDLKEKNRLARMLENKVSLQFYLTEQITLLFAFSHRFLSRMYTPP